MSDPTSAPEARGPHPWSQRVAGFLRLSRATDLPPAATTGETSLWRMRATVEDRPGSLARLCGALAARQVDILTLQTHPLTAGTVDELLLRAPAALLLDDLVSAARRGGGTDVRAERADAHDLVDAPARALELAARTALDPAELPLALRALLGRCSVRTVPAYSPTGVPSAESAPSDGVLHGTSMLLRDSTGGTVVVERPSLPFTPSEFARARALVALDARLGPRRPYGRRGGPLPGGEDVTIGEAGPEALPEALALHRRCSEQTLRLRYRGPAEAADSLVGHLLHPRFARTLAARTASGRLVGLGHLLPDGEEAEVALLVEDAWQGRGIGSALLRRLTVLAVRAGCSGVYAVTGKANSGMVAAMRELGLPLDHQVEDATVVVTATLDGEAVHALAPDGGPGLSGAGQSEH
ncbi:GNAT family N-acetyltransferase [Streptomyces fuscigenes]|uniref:GNAT family N-acetyltransferase n=1 Tax=Streptomyces fuscigenes TaxID=1528880 RepID=UPI001F2A7058|nr:GNAT family N-acetyltransferase [Streptomyces fuscigenes]MCF3961616.1 GNAT family N-acetyltransferase [Streptomyces fuscigenes]